MDVQRANEESVKARADLQAAKDQVAQLMSAQAVLTKDLANLHDQSEIKAKLAALEAERSLLVQIQAKQVNVEEMLQTTKNAVRRIRQALNLSSEESEGEDEDEDEDDGENSGDDGRTDGAGASSSGRSPKC